jgi:hypothetical protein
MALFAPSVMAGRNDPNERYFKSYEAREREWLRDPGVNAGRDFRQVYIEQKTAETGNRESFSLKDIVNT